MCVLESPLCSSPPPLVGGACGEYVVWFCPFVLWFRLSVVICVWSEWSFCCCGISFVSCVREAVFPSVLCCVASLSIMVLVFFGVPLSSI